MELLERFHSREDFHQSIQYAKVMEMIGWSSIPVSGARLSVRQLGPVSLAKMQRAHVIDFHSLYRLRARLKIFHLIIEPASTGTLIDTTGKSHSFSFAEASSSQNAIQLFKQCGVGVTGEHYAHSKTALIDLSDPIGAVVARFPSKTRYNIRISLRGVAQYAATPFWQYGKSQKKEFFAMHELWSREKKVMGYTNTFLNVMFACFSHSGWMIEARINGKLAGGMMVLVHDRIGYYFYTCSSRDGRATHIPTGMLYAALALSKDQGADIFDFCSVYDERYPSDHPRWKGFTQFKDRFAPIPVYYPPSFSRWL